MEQLRSILLLVIIVLTKFESVQSLDNGLGITPQMGYTSWMDTTSGVTEERIKYMAEALVSSGLNKLGYVYVNVDEGWLKSRDAQGNMVWDMTKFPSGMKALGDFIHSKGKSWQSVFDYFIIWLEGRLRNSVI